MREKVIEFFNAYFENKVLDVKSFDKDFFKMLQEQSLLPYAYIVFNNQNFKKFYISACLYQEIFNNEQSKITKMLQDNNVDHLYVKGSILNKIYDDPSLRTRGDIDIYINLKDMEIVKNLLIKDNYKAEENICMHHIALEKDKIMVEVHFSLFDPTDKEYDEYFKNPFAMSTLVDKNYYELNHEEHYLFCLAHFAKHLRNGAGLRYIFDFYYMHKKWNLNYDKLNKLISDLHFETLNNNILNAIEVLTKERFIDYQKIDINFFLDYLITSGIHGFGENNNFDTNNYAEKKHKFKHIFYTAFLINKNYRIAIYPKLGKKWYCYPLLLIHHLFYLFTHKFKSLLKFIFVRKKRSSKEKNDFYNKLGI